MPLSYHRFAGSSLDRLAALSDGVFAVAMTLLVLDLKAPAAAKSLVDNLKTMLSKPKDKAAA